MKWIGVVILVIIGALAAFVAVEYLTVSIHHLPSYLGPKKVHGHYHARGAIAAVIAFVLFVLAGYLAYRNIMASRAAASAGGPAVPTDSSVDAMLSEPQAGEEP